MILLLNGPPLSGKTELANMLVDLGATRIVLNTPFVQFVQKSLGLTDEEMKAGKDHVLQERGFRLPIRDALIAAADAVELVDPVVWVRRYFESEGFCMDVDVFKDPTFTSPPRGVYVLDALGKQAQYNWIDANVSLPSKVVRIFRPGTREQDSVLWAEKNYEYAFTDGRHHVALGDADKLIVDNSGSLDDLHIQATNIMKWAQP